MQNCFLDFFEAGATVATQSAWSEVSVAASKPSYLASQRQRGSTASPMPGAQVFAGRLEPWYGAADPACEMAVLRCEARRRSLRKLIPIHTRDARSATIPAISNDPWHRAYGIVSMTSCRFWDETIRISQVSNVYFPVS